MPSQGRLRTSQSFLLAGVFGLFLFGLYRCEEIAQQSSAQEQPSTLAHSHPGAGALYSLLEGLNYPHGILHWGDAIGLDHVIAVLDALVLERGEERYRAAPALRQLVCSGRLGRPTGEGFFSYEA